MRGRCVHKNFIAGNNARIFLFLIFYSLFLLTSCYTPRYVYSPAAQNVPLLTEKGDSKLGVVYSTNLTGTRTIDNQRFKGKSNGVDIHGAYALNKKFALQANFFSRSEINGGDFIGVRDSAVIRYKRHLTEIGAGYYTRLSEGELGQVFFQVFAGGGFGKFSFTDNGRNNNGDQTLNFHEATVSKFYIQPAIMVQNKKKSLVAVSSRFSIINYTRIQTDYDANELAIYELAAIDDGPVVFWEPSFINAIGFGKLPVRLEYQFGLSVLMSRRFIDSRSFNFSVGLQSDIARIFKKKAKTAKKE
ncbi:MAG: hypothetical protein H7Y86_16570 [Rhizobacter sp.]|nr:hypothetical protein [Ferruginibacter sp.]